MEEGLRTNISVGIQYMASWLNGNGCVPLYNLMEDAATAEISRAQIWQWIRHGAHTEDGTAIDTDRFDCLLGEEMQRVEQEVGAERFAAGRFKTAKRLFSEMIKKPSFDEFLTIPGYEHID